MLEDDNDVDEPPDSSDEDATGGAASMSPDVLLDNEPRPPSYSSSNLQAKGALPFTIKELLHVKLLWVDEKALKLRREDGSICAFDIP